MKLLKESKKLGWIDIQQFKTLRGQCLKGEERAAHKGFLKIIKKRGIREKVF